MVFCLARLFYACVWKKEKDLDIFTPFFKKKTGYCESSQVIMPPRCHSCEVAAVIPPPGVHTCVSSSPRDPGLGCVAVIPKWWCVTSEFSLQDRCGFCHVSPALGEEALSWAALWRGPRGEELSLPPTATWGSPERDLPPIQSWETVAVANGLSTTSREPWARTTQLRCSRILGPQDLCGNK